MGAFDPTQFGATPVAQTPAQPTGFDPSKFGAVAVSAPAAPAQQPDLLSKAAGIVGGIFPGQKLGEDIGTLGGYAYQRAKDALTGSHVSDFYDTSAPSPLEAAGDAANAGLLVGAGEAGAAKTLAGKLAGSAALGYGSDVATNAAQNNKIDLAPGFGTLIGAALPLSMGLVGALGKQVLAKTTGAGVEVLQRALDNPEAVNKAVQHYATTPEAQQSLVDTAKGAIGDYLHQRSLTYGGNLESMTSSASLQPQAVAASTFADKVANFGGQIKNGLLTFSNSTLTSTDQNNLQAAYKTISDWQTPEEGSTVKDADGLRQAIGNLMSDFKLTGNTRANVVLGDVQKAVRAHIADNVEGYDQTLKDYGDKTGTAQTILKELTLGGNAKPSTQLASIMRIFKKDPGVRDNLTQVMGKDGADNFLNEVSGAILSHWFPPGVVGNAARLMLEGGAGLAVGGGVNPVSAATAGAGLAASSPRIVGKATTILGRATKAGVGTALQRAGAIAGARIPPAPPSTPPGQTGEPL
jgi:hypothetical protein